MHAIKRMLWDKLMDQENQAKNKTVKDVTYENIKVIRDTAEAYVYACKASEWHSKEDKGYAEKEAEAMMAESKKDMFK